MKAVRCAVLVSMISAAPLLALAQAAAPVPVFNVGDTWTFDRITQTGAREPFTETVRLVTDERVGVLLSPSGRRKRFSPRMNNVDSHGGEVPDMKFPLTVGETWDSKNDWVNGNFFGTISRDYKVVALESIAVPAGRFEAYKIAVTGWNKDKSQALSAGGDIKVRETYWYSPEVKRMVKYQGRQTKWFSPQDVEVWALSFELNSYSLAEPAR